MSSPRDRDRLRGSETRLLRGYGPLICAVAAFLVMALIAPTVAPEQLVTSSVGGPQDGASSLSPSSARGGQSSPAASSSNPIQSSSSGQSSSAPSASGGGSAQATTQHAGAETCPGLQVPNDPYSPPCVTWARGASNGGATSRGVTGTTITLALRDTPLMDIASLVGEITGQQVQGASSPADVVRTYQVLAQFFNQEFQFYGRKLQIKVYNGQSSPATELLGGGQANATADAITESEQLHAFADVSIEAPTFSQALVGQHLVAMNPLYASEQWFTQYAPYAWGVMPSCTTTAQATVDLAEKYLRGPTAYAGGSLQGKPRKFGLVYPDNPAYATCGVQIDHELEAAGIPIADSRSYPLDFSTMQQSAQTVVSAFSSEGITTVLDGADALTTFFMTNYANEADWTPEWVETGGSYLDTDWAGQLYNKDEWAHAFGPSTLGATQPARTSEGYSAYESVSPSTVPAESDVELIFQQLELVAIGIQMAGPDLTPETFASGLRGYSSTGVGEAGRWGFPAGSYTAPQDARLIWWDPNATSVYNGGQGAYEDNGRRYAIGGFPAGTPPIFPNGIR